MPRSIRWRKSEDHGYRDSMPPQHSRSLGGKASVIGTNQNWPWLACIVCVCACQFVWVCLGEYASWWHQSAWRGLNQGAIISSRSISWYDGVACPRLQEDQSWLCGKGFSQPYRSPILCSTAFTRHRYWQFYVYTWHHKHESTQSHYTDSIFHCAAGKCVLCFYRIHRPIPSEML